MDGVESLAQQGVGIKEACDALVVSRATFYRHRREGRMLGPMPARPTPGRALTPPQRQEVLDVLYSERFINESPKAVWASLLDEGTYLCSARTMYRILASQGAVRERRQQRVHPSYKAPALVARATQEVWSWDITKLPGEQKGQWFYLYVAIDIFSRYVVGWMVASTETAELAKRFLGESAHKQGIAQGHLTIHSDRGAPMTSKKVAQMFDDLGIARSFSRPRVSNDNAFSESHFKSIKYHPTFPDTFYDIADVRHHVGLLMDWYNNAHYHEGIALLTPFMVHHGQADDVIAQRQLTLDVAHQAHPERFVKGAPRAPQLHTEVRIGRPATTLTRGGVLPN